MKDGSNWTFWKTRNSTVPQGIKTMPYISGVMQRPADMEVDKLAKWKKLSTSLIYDPHEHRPECASRLGLLISQSGLDGLTSRYAQVDPIAAKT